MFFVELQAAARPPAAVPVAQPVPAAVPVAQPVPAPAAQPPPAAPAPAPVAVAPVPAPVAVAPAPTPAAQAAPQPPPPAAAPESDVGYFEPFDASAENELPAPVFGPGIEDIDSAIKHIEEQLISLEVCHISKFILLISCMKTVALLLSL